jgi:hypothetical protein
VSLQATAELVVPGGSGEALHAMAWLPVESGGGPIESPSADIQVNIYKMQNKAILHLNVLLERGA